MKAIFKTTKGQLGSLSPAVLTLMVVAIIVSIAFIVLNNFVASTTTWTKAGSQNTTGCGGNATLSAGADPLNALCNMTTALQSNLVGNFSIIVIVVVFAVILGLIAFFRTAGRA